MVNVWDNHKYFFLLQYQLISEIQNLIQLIWTKPYFPQLLNTLQTFLNFQAFFYHFPRVKYTWIWSWHSVPEFYFTNLEQNCIICWNTISYWYPYFIQLASPSNLVNFYFATQWQNPELFMRGPPLVILQWFLI